MVHSIRFSSLSVFRLLITLFRQRSFFVLLHHFFSFDVSNSILFVLIRLLFFLLPQPHQYIMSITNERIKNDKATEHRFHIKWIQFHFIFSTCFICPRDKCERVFFSQNSFTLSILQSLVHEANVRFVCISDSNSYYEAKFPFGWLVSPLFNA